MNIVVLMAGEGRRFVDQGFKDLKPLIKVDGKPIFEWTLDSLPLKKVNHRLFFAIKSEHCEKFPLVETISDKFPSANYIFLDGKQRGNLFSAREATKLLEELQGDEFRYSPLLFLDADNHYDGSLFFDFIDLMDSCWEYPKKFGAVVSFKPQDESTKWGFVIPETKDRWKTRFRAKAFLEKHPDALKLGGMPMMGCFYFPSGGTFQGVSDRVLAKAQETEYYLTQAMSEMLVSGYQVLNYITPYVAPMGTPEDLKNFNGPYWLR